MINMVTEDLLFPFFLTKVEQIQNGGCKLLDNFAVYSFAAEQTNKQLLLIITLVWPHQICLAL